jgi:very-short-patch-repair endonuclease
MDTVESRTQPPPGLLPLRATGPIDRSFADFVCEAAKVIVELDSVPHDCCEDYHALCTQTLELFGYVVLRPSNERVLADPGGTTRAILSVLRSERV